MNTSLKTSTIKFMTSCPKCGKTEISVLHGLGKSHADRIKAMGDVYPNWHCSCCQNTVDARLSNVEVTEK